ncbi:MAG: hypothetical protein PUH09_06445 [Eubacteriales bacterium]|nr:hypothetical protein [Eubacteriales bacterium]
MNNIRKAFFKMHIFLQSNGIFENNVTMVRYFASKINLTERFFLSAYVLSMSVHAPLAANKQARPTASPLPRIASERRKQQSES